MDIKKITAAEFDALAAAGKALLVDFYADWCGPCRMLAPVIDQIAAEHPELTVCKVNVDEEGALAMRFGISSIPFVALVRDGRLVASALGYHTKDVLCADLGI